MREIALEPMRVPEHADPRASREMGQPAFYEGSLLPGTKEVSLVTEYSTRFHRIEASHHIWIMCFHRIVPKSKWKSFMYRFVSYCLQLDRSRYPRHGGLNMVLRICLGQRLPRHGRYLQVPGKGVSELLQQTWVYAQNLHGCCISSGKTEYRNTITTTLLHHETDNTGEFRSYKDALGETSFGSALHPFGLLVKVLPVLLLFVPFS